VQRGLKPILIALVKASSNVFETENRYSQVCIQANYLCVPANLSKVAHLLVFVSTLRLKLRAQRKTENKALDRQGSSLFCSPVHGTALHGDRFKTGSEAHMNFVDE
jgi:hypothetical protein